MFRRRWNWVVEGHWTHIDVDLKIARSLISCFGKEEEEHDKACGHEYCKKVKGPLPAEVVSSGYHSDCEHLSVCVFSECDSSIRTTDRGEKCSAKEADVGEGHAETSFVDEIEITNNIIHQRLEWCQRNPLHNSSPGETSII